jgi:flagellar biosynthesis protein FliQ
MGTEQVVALFRHTLQMALLMGAPLLLIAVFVSLLVNVAQVLTSLQDQTLSTCRVWR